MTRARDLANPASQTEVETGTGTDLRALTPQRLAQAIAALATSYNITDNSDATWLTVDSSEIATFAGKVLFSKGVVEQAVSLTGTAVDCTLGSYFYKTISGATTLTFTNPASSGDVTSFTLELTNAGTNMTFPASVDWAGGTAPTLTASGVDVLTFVTRDGGTTWLGFAAGLDMK